MGKNDLTYSSLKKNQSILLDILNLLTQLEQTLYSSTLEIYTKACKQVKICSEHETLLAMSE